jgi:hypothetical protein
MSVAGCQGLEVIHGTGVLKVGLRRVERREHGLQLEMVHPSHGDCAKGLMHSWLLLGAKGAVKM